LRHRLLFLNLLLALLTGAIGWQLRRDWVRDHQHSSSVLNERVKPAAAPVPAPVAPPAPFAGQAYADVAQKDLFSKDRNPDVIIEPVAVKPAPKWPRMPVLSGVMGLPGGLVAMLAESPSSRSRGVSVGGTIGAMKVTALTADKITFEFEGQSQEKNVQDLVDRDNHAEAADAAAASQNPAAIAAAKSAPPTAPKPGADVGLGAQAKACDPRDTSPSGTEVDGYKKVIKVNPFGSECTWVAK
jgi:hypothetical protein